MVGHRGFGVVKAQQLWTGGGWEGQAGDRRWKSQADGVHDDDAEGQGVKTRGAGNLNRGDNLGRTKKEDTFILQFANLLRKSESNFHK